MGVGPDGACGGRSGGGESWPHRAATARRGSKSDAGTRTLVMAGRMVPRRVGARDNLHTWRNQDLKVQLEQSADAEQPSVEGGRRRQRRRVVVAVSYTHLRAHET